MINSVRKAINYCKRNGIKDTLIVSAERLLNGNGGYGYRPVSALEIVKQKEREFVNGAHFSIVVPAYETNPKFLRQLINSVIGQTYSQWELIIADASDSNVVVDTVMHYTDNRVRYVKLPGNDGISENTNVAIDAARGDYIGLLDHDDYLTPDALYENALMIEMGEQKGVEYAFIYSDEDKCASNGLDFFDPNFKPGFDIDLLMTNNYICHFLVMKAELMKRLKLRREFDGAQDHDLVLRAYAATAFCAQDIPVEYGHIPKVLYHWRTHRDSTAANPESKEYAYEAGLRAVEDYIRSQNIHAKVLPTKHKGFMRVEYIDYLDYSKGSDYLKDNVGRSGEEDFDCDDIAKNHERLISTARGRLAYNIFLNRVDVGAIGGPVIRGKRHVGGIIGDDKTFTYDGMNAAFQGYLHRAELQQEGYGLDIRNMMISDNLAQLVVDLARDEKHMHIFDKEAIASLSERIASGNINAPYVDVSACLTKYRYPDYEYLVSSIELARRIRLEGCKCVYDPEFLY